MNDPLCPWDRWMIRCSGSAVRPALSSASAVAESKQAVLCTYLSGILLAGLLPNALFGWSWADPLVALVIAVVAVKGARSLARRAPLPTA